VPVRPAVVEVRDSSSGKVMQVFRERGTQVCSSSEPPSEEMLGRVVEDGKTSNFSPPDALLVLPSNSPTFEAKDVLDPAAFEAALSTKALGNHFAPKSVEHDAVLACAGSNEVSALSTLCTSVPMFGNKGAGIKVGESHPTIMFSEASAQYQGGWCNRQEGPAKDWSLAVIGNTTRNENSSEPLAVDFSFVQGNNTAFSAEEAWDGENLNSEYVSKWVASKLKSIAGCIGVAFTGYEGETIQLLSRIEKSIVPVKSSVQRLPPSSRSLRELRRLEFGVNYDRSIASSSGLKVFNG